MWDAKFSDDGTQIIAEIRKILGHRVGSVWDVRSGERVANLEGSEISAGRNAGYSPDGIHFVTVAYDRTAMSGRTAHVCDARSGEQIARLEGHEASLEGVAFLPDGARIITVSEDRTARIWDARSGEQLVCIVLDSGVTALAVSANAFALGEAGQAACL